MGQHRAHLCFEEMTMQPWFVQPAQPARPFGRNHTHARVRVRRPFFPYARIIIGWTGWTGWTNDDYAVGS